MVGVLAHSITPLLTYSLTYLLTHSLLQVQCVHMIFDGYLGPIWGVNSRQRRSKLVIIGNNLNVKRITNEFQLCQV